MEPATALAFSIAIFGALVSPGPAFLALTKSSVSGGRLQGILTGLGLASAATLWSFTAFAGLTALFALVPAAFLIMKIAGAAYLLWLAWSLWRHADQGPDTTMPRGPKGFALGFVTNLANPKAVIFIAAIFSTILPAGMSIAAKGQILLLHFTIEAVFYTGCAIILTTQRARAGYLRLKRVFDRCAAILLGGMALRMAS